MRVNKTLDNGSNNIIKLYNIKVIINKPIFT